MTWEHLPLPCPYISDGMGQSHCWSCRDLERGMCESSSLNNVGAYPIQIHHKWGERVVRDSECMRMSWHVLKEGRLAEHSEMLTKKKPMIHGFSLGNTNGTIVNHGEPFIHSIYIKIFPTKRHRKCGSLPCSQCPPTTASRAASKAGPGFLATTSAGVSSTSLTITFGTAGNILLISTWWMWKNYAVVLITTC